MSDSHVRSNIRGKLGSEELTNFATISGAAVTATSYITVGTNKYIFNTTVATQALVVAEATALVGASVKGSIGLGDGKLWLFTSDTAATNLLTV